MGKIINREEFTKKLCSEFGVSSFDELPDYIKSFTDIFVKCVNQNNMTIEEYDDVLRRLESKS